jgi:DHA2 family methylenomycin A resistance protein-like MFS transporter
MRIALSVGFAFMIGWFGTVFLASLFLQQHLGLPPLLAGLAFLPSAVCSVVGNLISGPVTNRFGTRVPVVAGQTTMVIGLAGLAVTAPLGSPVLVAVLVMFVGAGGSLAMPPTTGVVLASVPAALAGTASAVFNTFRQVGGAIAIAVFGALVADRELFVPGMQLSMACAAGALTATALASLAIRPGGLP